MDVTLFPYQSATPLIRVRLTTPGLAVILGFLALRVSWAEEDLWERAWSLVETAVGYRLLCPPCVSASGSGWWT